MSHNISFAGGKGAEVFTAGKPAWHKLGVTVEKAQTWEKAVELANLDWTISKQQFTSPITSGELVPAFGIFRDDTKSFLGSCGPNYETIQNRRAFEFVDALLEAEKGAHYEVAGALGQGEIIWCLARIPGQIRIKNTDDLSIPYMLFTDFREQGRSAICKLSMVRVVCSNTLQMSLSDKYASDVLRIRHTGVEARMLEAKKAFRGIKMDVKALEEKMNELAVRRMTRESMTTVLERLFPKINDSTAQQNKAAEILAKYEFNDGNAFPSEKGTALNCLNAITNWVDHARTARFVDDARPTDVKQAQAAVFGAGDAWKSHAVTTIMEATENAPRAANAPEVFDMGKALAEINDLTNPGIL